METSKTVSNEHVVSPGKYDAPPICHAIELFDIRQRTAGQMDGSKDDYQMRLKRERPRAFTLIELLVVVAIIALLVAILVPALEGARRQAQVVTCNANLHHFGVGLNIWVSSHDGKYPPNPTSTACGPNKVYNGDYIVYGFGDYLSYMRDFIDIVAGRTEILFCPLDETWRPLLDDPAYVDPDIGPYVLNAGSPPANPSYNMGYLRFAGAEPVPPAPTNVGFPMTWDFTNSGNADPTKGPMEPGLAQDAILCDIIWSDVTYGDVHASDYNNAAATHNENNVAYGDGHAETHYHTPIQDGIGYWYWPDHYVKRGIQYLLY